MKFKVGDRVKLVNPSSGHDVRSGDEGTVVRISSFSGLVYIHLDKSRVGDCWARSWEEVESIPTGRLYLAYPGEVALIKRGGVRMKAPKFVLLYDLDDEDPYETFLSKRTAEKRISILVESGAENILLVTVAKVEKVTTPSRFELKEVK